EREYFLASSRTRARPFWLTKSTIERLRSSFNTDVRLLAMVAYEHIRTKKREQPPISAGGQQKRLVHRDRLHQIARTVDIQALAHRDVIRQELQRHDLHDRQQKFFHVRQGKRSYSHGANCFVAFGGQ